jgi:hypothetical protein
MPPISTGRTFPLNFVHLASPNIETPTSTTMPSERPLPTRGLPPFLFRAASSNGSRGINTAEEIDPLAGTGGEYHSNIESITELPRLLYDHINYEYRTPSEFSSWSVSLLYVLVHANRKAHHLCEANVVLYVLDTRKLESSRVRSAVGLLKENRVASKRDILEQYAEGEFLIHGKLVNGDGKLWHTVDFEDLMDAGLWDCFWHFRKEIGNEEKLKGLFPLVMRMRGGWFKEVTALHEFVVPPLQRLARCFGEEWERVVMVALLCMRKRALNPEGMAAIEEAVRGMSIVALDWEGDVKLRVPI